MQWTVDISFLIDISNYKGQSLGTNAGRTFKNNKNDLLNVDNYGNTITYKEYDVNSKIPGSGRDAERFVRGSDGSVYYTDNHYSPGSFIKIK